MMYYKLTMICHDVPQTDRPWYIMMYCKARPWYIMMYCRQTDHDIPWCTTNWPWYIIMYYKQADHYISWCTTNRQTIVYHDVPHRPWYIMMYHKHTMIHYDVLQTDRPWYIMMYYRQTRYIMMYYKQTDRDTSWCTADRPQSTDHFRVKVLDTQTDR